jgi:FeS assembly SUF system regulator
MLRITRQTDYGLVLLAQFAGAGAGAVRTARELADASAIPLPTVSKVLKILSRHGLLVSLRGVHGGYSLARTPAEVSVAEVIGALDGPIALTECLTPETDPCSLESCCPTRTHWGRINRAVRDALSGLSLAQMVESPSGAGRLVSVEPLSGTKGGAA